jgi:hypothetical protein
MNKPTPPKPNRAVPSAWQRKSSLRFARLPVSLNVRWRHAHNPATTNRRNHSEGTLVPLSNTLQVSRIMTMMVRVRARWGGSQNSRRLFRLALLLSLELLLRLLLRLEEVHHSRPRSPRREPTQPHLATQARRRQPCQVDKGHQGAIFLCPLRDPHYDVTMRGHGARNQAWSNNEVRKLTGRRCLWAAQVLCLLLGFTC